MQFTCVYCFRFVSVRNLLLNFLQSYGFLLQNPCPLIGLTHLEFSGLHCCLFVKVRFLSLDWKLFCLVQTQLWYNIMCFILCQDFFQTFWISFPPLPLCFSRWIFIITLNPKICQRINLNLCVPRSFCLTAFTTEAKNLEVLCFQHFHLLYWQLNGERGIWTLAPRERPTPLAGAPLQPLEYFSIIWIASRYQYSVMSFSQRKSYYT